MSVSAAGSLTRSSTSCVVSSQQLQDPTSSPVTTGSFPSTAWPTLSDGNGESLPLSNKDLRRGNKAQGNNRTLKHVLPLQLVLLVSSFSPGVCSILNVSCAMSDFFPAFVSLLVSRTWPNHLVLGCTIYPFFKRQISSLLCVIVL